MQRRSGTDERVEARLAVLLRPGPRRALFEPDSADDTLIGDRAADLGEQGIDQNEQGIDLDEQDADLDGTESTGGNGLDHDSPEVEMLRPATDAAEWSERRRPGSVSVGARLRSLLPIDKLGAFGPPQLVVIVVIVLLGLLFGGWAILRARPVAIAAPQVGATAHAGPSPSLSPATAVASPTPSGTPSAAPPASGPAPSPSATIKVHVLGAVRDPGVVTLPTGSRVQDGLDKAGGVKKSADLGDLNLAQPLLDGQQVFIGRGDHGSEVRGPDTAAGTIPSSPTSSGGPPDPGSGSAPADGQGSGPVNLNTATLDQLDALPGVGPVTAQKILDWRTEHGRFSSAEELQEVDGIGPKTYADLAPQVTV